MQFLKQIFGLVLIIGVGYILYGLAMQNSGGPRDFSVSPDSTATFSGTVLLNNSSCLTSNRGNCFLQIKSGKSEVFVIYNSNDSEFCKNEIAGSVGKGIKENTVVKVYGFYKLENKIHTVLTCPNNDYYIKSL